MTSRFLAHVLYLYNKKAKGIEQRERIKTGFEGYQPATFLKETTQGGSFEYLTVSSADWDTKSSSKCRV